MDITIAILVYIIQGLIFGFVSRYIANSKGYDGGFAWGFWLGLIGVLVVGFRPNINQTTTSQENKTSYLINAQLKPNRQWECGCGTMNPDSLNYCLSCRRTRGEYKPVEKVRCPHCGSINKVTNDVCFACNKPLRAVAQSDVKSPLINSDSTTNNIDFSDALEKLASLHEKGILTDEEFTAKKKDILAKI